MLSHLIFEVSDSLPANQFGFTSERNVRGSCFVLRTLIDLDVDVDLGENQNMVVTFQLLIPKQPLTASHKRCSRRLCE
jgi:hypothetical protein